MFRPLAIDSIGMFSGDWRCQSLRGASPKTSVRGFAPHVVNRTRLLVELDVDANPGT